jgi:hypothetical protein
MKKAMKRLARGVVLTAVLSVAFGAFSLEGRSVLKSVLTVGAKPVPEAYVYVEAKPQPSWAAASLAGAGEVHGTFAHGPTSPTWVQSLDVSRLAEKHLPLLSGPGVAAGHYTVAGHWVPAGQVFGAELDLLASGRFGAPAAGTPGGRGTGAASFEGLQLASASWDGEGRSPGATRSDPGNGWQAAFYSQGGGSGLAPSGGGVAGADTTGMPADMGAMPIRVAAAAVSPIPEPGTYALMLAGLLGIFFMRRRRPV